MQNSNNHSNQSFFPKSHNITKEYHSEEEENYYDTEDESFGPLHKRVDFLSLLPYEVVNLILGQLSTSDLITCLDVCPIWLRLLQKLPNLWYEVIAEHEEYHISSYLPLIGNHVHKYRIYYGCQEILDKSVAGILAGTMDNLESLAWDCSDFIGSDVLSCIHHLRSSLTELELVSTQDTRYLEAFNTPSLSSILNACPTLKRLNVSLHDSIIDDPKEDDNWFPQDLKLTHLHWHPGAYTTIKEAENILVACPLLIYLSISYFEDSISVLTFRNQSPLHLQYLHLDVYDHNNSGLYSNASNNDYPQSTKSSNNNNITSSSLRGLSTRCESREHWNELETIIRKDQNTLQNLTICHRETFDLAVLLGIFKGSTLSLNYGYDIYWRSRASISVILNTDIPSQKEIENKSSLSQKHQLRITSLFETSTFQQRHLPWFINGLMNKGNVASIQFNDCNIGTPHIQSLLQFSSLQELSITTITQPSLGIEPLTTLLDGICKPTSQPRAPRIRRLCLGPITGMTDAILARFADIQGLKILTLRKCDGITDDGVRYLVDRSSYLEMLSILDCKDITSEAQDYIKQNIR